MASKKITDLPVAAVALLTDILEVVQAGASQQETVQKIADLLGLGSGKTSFNNATGAATMASGNFTVDAAGGIANNSSANLASGAFIINSAGGTNIIGGTIQLTDPTVSLQSAILVNADNNAGNGLITCNDTAGSGQAFAVFNALADQGLFGLAGGKFIVQSSTTPELTIEHSGGGPGSIGAQDGTFSGTLIIGNGTPIQTVLSGTAVLDFPNTPTQTSSDLTINVPGAVDGDTVFIGVPSGSVDADSCFTAFVSAADTVTVRFNNYSAGSIDPASGTFRAAVFSF